MKYFRKIRLKYKLFKMILKNKLTAKKALKKTKL